MKNRLIYSLFIFSAIFAMFSCKPNITKRLPAGNFAEINTKADDYAPINLPSSEFTLLPCESEFQPKNSDNRSNVKPSSHFLSQLFSESLAERIEVVSFITNNRGIMSVPHPPDAASAMLKNIPFFGSIGGTDLFEFYYENDEFKFKNLGTPINTKTWDSHPFAISNGFGKVLLIWSSDRIDNQGGFSSPYRSIKNLQNQDTLIGNTDLYYSFYSNGNWTHPRNFAHFNRGINTMANEESPHVYCLCFNTKLIFSSNRNNSDRNDYDLYYINILLDFELDSIQVLSNPELLEPKSFEGINTEAKEFFPFIPKPYSDDENVPNLLYFSSDRFKNEYSLEKNKTIKNVGNFDLYHFPIPFNCQPPKVTLVVQVLDSLNPNGPLKGPFNIELLGENKRIVTSESSNPARFKLRYNGKYYVRGTSLYNQVDCTGEDSVVSNYRIVHRRLLDTIIEKEIVITYDSIVGGRQITRLDSSLVRETVHLSELTNLRTIPQKAIKELKVDGDSIIVNWLVYQQRIETIQGRSIKLERKEIKRERIQKIIEQSLSAKDYLNYSVHTRGNYLPSQIYNEDIVIYDTIYVVPEYFRFPPCKWEYITIMDDYRRNVPYFQTGFWEVNTFKNFNRHINELRSRRYNGASFIELQPENMHFGYRRGDMDSNQRERRYARWENRVHTYRQFARKVDRNLNEMVYEIADVVLPKFHTLDSLMPNMNSRLIIQLEAYSDFRDIIGGRYLTDHNVRYLSANFVEASSDFRSVAPIRINTGDEMDTKNEILSQLRAYFGYKELIALLKNNPLFKKYLDAGLVILPDEVNSERELNEQIADKKIIITTIGKRIDENAIPKHTGYRGLDTDYYMLDSVRRVNVVVHRVQYSNGRIVKTKCCSDTPPPPPRSAANNKILDNETDESIIKSVLNNSIRQFNVSAAQIKINDDFDLIAIETSNAEFFQISCGSFKNKQTAEMIMKILIEEGIKNFSIENVELEGENYYRVRSAKFHSANDARIKYEKLRRIISKRKIDTEIIIIPI